MFDIEWIKNKIKNDEDYFSIHADQERQNEQYPDTGRGESCLVVGFTNNGKPVHIVCGERNDKVIIITVYIPLPPKFKNPYERG